MLSKSLALLSTLAFTGGAAQDYTAADAHFMSGIIYHHAQAVLIAGWARSHEASPSLRALCERIAVGQSDEIRSLALAIGLGSLAACASSGGANLSTVAPNPDPRVGLRAGFMNAAEASWNLRVVSKTPPPEQFAGITNSDLAFTGNYAIQGNYNGFQVWDISNPAKPTLKVGFVCPASQSDVSVYQNLLFVSGEGMGGRLDCGKEGVHDSVSASQLRGIRIFDISDIAHPKYIANVQTCRGSHTHTVVVAPNDKDNVYVYVSGSAPVRVPTWTRWRGRTA